jgi:hypothetical protein
MLGPIRVTEVPSIGRSHVRVINQRQEQESALAHTANRLSETSHNRLAAVTVHSRSSLSLTASLDIALLGPVEMVYPLTSVWFVGGDRVRDPLPINRLFD